jgi:hypothetical protein
MHIKVWDLFSPSLTYKASVSSELCDGCWAISLISSHMWFASPALTSWLNCFFASVLMPLGPVTFPLSHSAKLLRSPQLCSYRAEEKSQIVQIGASIKMWSAVIKPCSVFPSAPSSILRSLQQYPVLEQCPTGRRCTAAVPWLRSSALYLGANCSLTDILCTFSVYCLRSAFYLAVSRSHSSCLLLGLWACFHSQIPQISGPPRVLF